ncbi:MULTISPECIES: ATP-binding protein [unclassified Algibacter]|uniref:ATP-binding protein n=1 Tax=unclassified Algibacter TaxID=2615009 RepID=UPI00131C11D7|nr:MULTISPECIES: ATP-binding protein [unclassified Algibacter]MCL5130438.1 AAA family ATPase [Algibacter sp. L4_22]
MDNTLLESLLKALEFSPENIELRFQIAKLYSDGLNYEEAEKHLLFILDKQPTDAHKFLLAECYYKQKKYNLTEVILEELIENNEAPNYLELQCFCYIDQNQTEDALATYQRILEIDKTFRNEEFENLFRVPVQDFDDDFFDEDGISFLKKPDINFDNVGGMEKVKEEIDLKIIKPLLHKDLYKAYGKKIGGGILLYGPPGCGKTHIARATAGQINANFINIGINDILDMWLGSSERNLHEIFETARANTPCVIFIDEIDALGANRNDVNKTAGRTVINQFLSELDGIDSDNEGILVLGATNAPWYIDPAFRRPGRFDRIIFVAPPDEAARESIFKIELKDKPTENIKLQDLAKKSKEFSGADIKASIDIAIEQKLVESFKDGIPKPLTTKDILKAFGKMKASTREWFNSAKNYALYSNDSGLYDDILVYLKMKK